MGDITMQRGAAVGWGCCQHRLPHGVMAEAVPRITGHEHQGVDRSLEVGEGVVSVALREGDDLVGADVHPEQGEPLHEHSGRGRQGGDGGRHAGATRSSGACSTSRSCGGSRTRRLQQRERQSAAECPELFRGTVREVRVARGEQVHGLVQGQRGQVEP